MESSEEYFTPPEYSYIEMLNQIEKYKEKYYKYKRKYIKLKYY